MLNPWVVVIPGYMHHDVCRSLDGKGQSSLRHVELIALASKGSAYRSNITLVYVHVGHAAE